MLVPVEISFILSICLGFSMFFGGIVTILEYVWRKKVLMR